MVSVNSPYFVLVLLDTKQNNEFYSVMRNYHNIKVNANLYVELDMIT